MSFWKLGTAADGFVGHLVGPHGIETSLGFERLEELLDAIKSHGKTAEAEGRPVPDVPAADAVEAVQAEKDAGPVDAPSLPSPEALPAVASAADVPAEEPAA